MAYHPSGITVDIVGTEASDRGRNCEEHSCCGNILELDVVVRLRAVQIVVDGVEEEAIAAYWVSDGIDRCRVGFLPRHLIKHKKKYNGKLAQIVDMYKDSDSPTKRKKHHHNRGCCLAALIDSMHPSDFDNMTPPTKRQRTEENNQSTEEKG